MDWAAIARILGERSTIPIALLDKAGRIRLFNRAMEQALGWSRFEVEGQPWTQICAPANGAADAKRWIQEALRGALWSYETVVVTKTGGKIVLHVDLSPVGRGAEQALLVTVTRATPGRTPRAVSAGADMDYDVTVVGSDFGVVCRLCVDGEVVAVTETERRCYALLYGLEQPCADCPLRVDRHRNDWPRITVRQRRSSAPDGSSLALEVTTAEPLDPTIVRLRVRTISERTLGAIHDAKLQQIAEQANLSQRERDVLRYLVMGRSIEDIATILDITQRTVKYHQANVIKKVGADSRVDLVRLLF